MPRWGTLPERFEEKVMPEPNSGCWIWTGRLTDKGYGIILVSGRPERAHRVSLALAGIPIPVGMEPDHKCRIRCCVNPAHLEPVTHSINVLRGRSPSVTRERLSALTFCKYGHPYDDSNTGRQPSGRYCLECKRIRGRRLYAEGGHK